MANDPPIATLNHFAADLGIPKRVRITADWYLLSGIGILRRTREHEAMAGSVAIRDPLRLRDVGLAALPPDKFAR